MPRRRRREKRKLKQKAKEKSRKLRRIRRGMTIDGGVSTIVVGS